MLTVLKSDERNDDYVYCVEVPVIKPGSDVRTSYQVGIKILQPCVYKDNTSGQFIPKFYVYIEKSATETAYEVSKFTGYKAGFYERGTHDETPTFSNAEFGVS